MFSINTHKNYIYLSIVAVLSLVVATTICNSTFLFVAVLFLLLCFILFIKNPELALAILFNGTLIYLYAVYKLGFETSRVMTGGFYGLLAVSYLLGGVLFVARKPRKFRTLLVDVLFIIFFLWVFLSYFIFHTGSESAYRKIAYAPLLAIAPYFGARLLLSEKRKKKFFDYCVLVTAILIIPAFYELLFNPILTKSGRGRFSMFMFKGGEDNPILFGITFAILLIILFVRMSEQRKLRFNCLILMIPSMFLLLRSGSRGAVISFLVTMSFYLSIIGRLRFKTKVYAAILIIFLILGTYKILPERIIDFYQYAFTPEARLTKVSSIYQRINLWKEAFTEFVENPILGVGIGNSAGGTGFPHNILLEVSAELGIVGLFMFLSMCYLTVKKAITFLKIEERQDLRLLMKLSSLLFIYNLVEAMFSGYITNQTQLFMSMGLVISLVKLKQGEISPRERSIKT